MKVLFLRRKFEELLLQSWLFLSSWKPLHICWLFEKYNLPIPKYFVGKMIIINNQINLKHIHFRNDDGASELSELGGGATYIVAIDVEDVSFPLGTNRRFRVRFQMLWNANRTHGFVFRYNINGGGFNFGNDINLVSPYVRIADTTFYSNGDETTAFLLGAGTEHDDPEADQLQEADGGAGLSQTGLLTASAGEISECEITFEIVDSDLSETDTVGILPYTISTLRPAMNGIDFTPLITIVAAPTEVAVTKSLTYAVTVPTAVGVTKSLTYSILHNPYSERNDYTKDPQYSESDDSFTKDPLYTESDDDISKDPAYTIRDDYYKP